MKILYLIDSLAFGGAERQFVELIKGLDRSRYEVHLICLNKETAGYTDILTELGVIVHYFCRAYKYDIRPVFSVSRYINKNQIDLVHPFMNLGGLVGVLAAKLSGRPVVCSAIRDAKDKGIKGAVSKKALSILADIFVANSRAGFTNRFHNIKPHFRVVYNGIDFSRFNINTNNLVELKQNLGIDRFEYIIGMVGSLSKNKDQETLTRFRKLQENVSSIISDDICIQCLIQNLQK